MKKFYALAFGVCAAMAANAQTTVSLAGGFNGWSAEANPMTETSTGIYETDVPELLTEFKVVVTDANGAQWLGSNEVITLGTPLFVENIEGGGNVNFADGVKVVNNAHVKYELGSSMLTVTGEAGELEVSYGIHGSFATGDWATTPMTKGADGMWSATFTDLTPMATPGEFGIMEMDDKGNQLSWIAAGVAGVVISDEMEDIELTKTNTSNLAVSLTGAYTFIYNADEMLLTVTKATGINDIAAEIAEGEAEYFNLQGVRVMEPAAGLYLVRKAGKVSKVIVK